MDPKAVRSSFLGIELEQAALDFTIAIDNIRTHQPSSMKFRVGVDEDIVRLVLLRSHE